MLCLLEFSKADKVPVDSCTPPLVEVSFALHCPWFRWLPDYAPLKRADGHVRVRLVCWSAVSVSGFALHHVLCMHQVPDKFESAVLDRGRLRRLNLPF